MKRTPLAVEESSVSKNPQSQPQSGDINSRSRRSFIGKLGAASVAAGVLGKVPTALAQSGQSSAAKATSNGNRVALALQIRTQAATSDSKVPAAPHTTNGDENRYHDKSATYTKGLLQDDIGVVNPAAWVSFKTALRSGLNSDFENVIIGGTRTQNGPQGSYAFDMEGLDSSQYGDAPAPGDPSGPSVVPAFAQITSADYGTQLTELYWGAMLRDVAFTDYVTDPTAAAAAAELSGMPAYRGPRDANGKVTPANLFRGPWAGESIGPYMSQLMILPTMLGVQPINQLLQTLLPGIDYITDTTTFLQVQNGISTGQSLQHDSVFRYLHNGRGLASYTHEDVLYQAYYTALLVLQTLKAPVNPGNPYLGSRTQNGFSTFGGADFPACLGEVAARALNRVWYQKWLVHLTHRPESGGGVLHQILSGNQNRIQARLNSNVLNSQAVQQVFSQYGTYLLPQAFPEGSPTHPSYPTGHGTVAGACITFLKFFFDENWVIPNPMVPSNDGLSLQPYTGSDAGQITVLSELHKLADNVSFGHGIHAGIHWRQDTDISVQLGEALAIGILQDKARCYHEKFSISFTRLDGSKCTITN